MVKKMPKVVDSGQTLVYNKCILGKEFKLLKCFSGEQYHQLDAKNRIRIPAKFKSEISEKLVFSKGVTPCIYVLPYSEYAEMIEKFSELSQFDVESQLALSVYMASFEVLEEDNQGRILLPNSLLEHAGIEKNVVTVGVKNRLEIWSEERRKSLTAKKSFEEYMAILSSRLS